MEHPDPKRGGMGWALLLVPVAFVAIAGALLLRGKLLGLAPVAVEIRGDGSFWVGGEPVTADGLRRTLQHEAQKEMGVDGNSERALLLRVDPMARWDRFLEALWHAQDAGIWKVSVAQEPGPARRYSMPRDGRVPYVYIPPPGRVCLSLESDASARAATLWTFSSWVRIARERDGRILRSEEMTRRAPLASKGAPPAGKPRLGAAVLDAGWDVPCREPLAALESFRAAGHRNVVLVMPDATRRVLRAPGP